MNFNQWAKWTLNLTFISLPLINLSLMKLPGFRGYTPLLKTEAHIVLIGGRPVAYTPEGTYPVIGRVPTGFGLRTFERHGQRLRFVK